MAGLRSGIESCGGSRLRSASAVPGRGTLRAGRRERPGNQDRSKRNDQSGDQAGERSQSAYARDPEPPSRDEQRVNHRSDDKDEQDLLPKRPILQWHLQDFVDLVGRPRPDEANKSEDGGNALLQQLQELVENLLHGRPSLAPARCTVSPQATLSISVSSKAAAL